VKPEPLLKETVDVVEPKPGSLVGKAGKVIDYNQIFKVDDANANDDDDAFMNDPELKNAPDFEW